MRVVLCIEDEPAHLELNQIHLSRAGYSVICASSPKDALATLALSTVDVIVSDQSFRCMNPGELIRQIRALQPGVPILIYSAKPAEFARQSLPKDIVYLERTAGAAALVSAVATLIAAPPKN